MLLVHAAVTFLAGDEDLLLAGEYHYQLVYYRRVDDMEGVRFQGPFREKSPFRAIAEAGTARNPVPALIDVDGDGLTVRCVLLWCHNL